MSASNVSQTTDSFNSIAWSDEETIESSPRTPGVEARSVMRPEDLQMAHDLCTPLTALKSAIELLCQADLPEEAEHMAHIAQRNVDRIAALVEEMLSKRALSS